jgi:hypothetical protein
MLRTMLGRVQPKSRDILRSSIHFVSTCEPFFDPIDILDLSLLIRVGAPAIYDIQLRETACG